MPLQYGKIGEFTPPSPAAEGTSMPVRLTRRGGLVVDDTILSLVKQGSNFRAVNPIFGTGIAMGIQTTFSDTANVLAILRNTDAAIKIIPHYLRLICTVAGATTTSSRMGLILDNANRYSSGGTDLTTSIQNSESAVGTSSVADLKFGALTAAAANAKKQIANLSLKAQAAPCWVVGDEVIIDFLGQAPQMGLLSGAGANSIVKKVDPVILDGQNHSLLFHMWNIANATTAPSWEVEASWFEV